jgi:predicted dehydrogenase
MSMRLPTGMKLGRRGAPASGSRRAPAPCRAGSCTPAGWASEIDHFLEVAAGRAESACTPRDALNTLLVAEAAERSRLAGAPVSVRRAEDLL